MSKIPAANDTSKRLDKFYTKHSIATELTNRLHAFLKSKELLASFDQVVEPSAGDGSFLKPLNQLAKPVVAMDIAPDAPGISAMDFFSYETKLRCLYVGNPPYGWGANKAVRFFNHATLNGAEIVAFIVPRTFRKVSVQRRLDRRFHLLLDEDLPARSFLCEGVEWDVPSAFQVWQRQEILRDVTPDAHSEWIQFTKPENATHAIRRVGRRAGDLLQGLGHSKTTTLFFTVSDRRVLSVLQGHPKLREIGNSTAAVRSISKTEIRAIVNEEMRAATSN